MINRSLIRLKIVQLIYSFYQNGKKNIDNAEKELLFSLGKAYDLYQFLLLLIVEVTKYEAEQIENQEEINKIAHKDTLISHKFVDNEFVKQLHDNRQLTEFCEKQKYTWMNNPDYLKKLLVNIKNSEYYQDYMVSEDTSYEADKELWKKLYKTVIMKDLMIDEVLEDACLYWNDDKEIIDTFVVKTIKRFKKENGEEQQLLPEFKDDEDRQFALQLFKETIVDDQEYRDLIAKSIKNWEFDRLAFMDVVIMQIAIAELMNFDMIPTVVTINEYVDIAKYYSTPNSAAYVNGILDNIVKRLKKENIIIKN